MCVCVVFVVWSFSSLLLVFLFFVFLLLIRFLFIIFFLECYVRSVLFPMAFHILRIALPCLSSLRSFPVFSPGAFFFLSLLWSVFTLVVLRSIFWLLHILCSTLPLYFFRPVLLSSACSSPCPSSFPLSPPCGALLRRHPRRPCRPGFGHFAEPTPLPPALPVRGGGAAGTHMKLLFDRS